LTFIVFELLKSIEPNSTKLYDPRIRLKSVHPWAPVENFPGGAMSKLCLSYSGC